MSLKYRIRMANERVVGPLTEQEIIEMFEKNLIDGNELCQQFPIGDWKKLKEFPIIYNEIYKIQESRELVILKEKEKRELELKKSIQDNKQKETNKDEKTRSDIEQFKEFKFNQGAKVEVDYKELERKHRLENMGVTEEEINDGIEKTVAINKKNTSKEIEKTVVLNKKEVKKEGFHNLDELKILAEKERQRELEEAEKRKIQLEIEKRQRESLIVKLEKHDDEGKSTEQLASEQTQFIDLNEVLPNINAQLRASEIELEKQAKVQESQERHQLKIEREQMIKDKILDNVQSIQNKPKQTKRKKGMSWIVAFAFLAIIYTLLFPDEEQKKQDIVPFKIVFPTTKEFEDSSMAIESLNKARSLYAENFYLKRIQAAKLYLNSVESKFNDNEALGELLLVNAELLDNSDDIKKASNVLYKIVKISEKDILKDPNSAAGAALFYGKIKKPNTGIINVKNFLRLGSKPNIKLLSAYLDLLIQAGELNSAREVFEKIKSIPKKPFEVYASLAQFLLNDDKTGEALSLVEEGLKFYPNSTMLLLKKAEIHLKTQSIKEYEATLLKIKKLEAEYSPNYYAQYLKHSGMLAALKGKNQEAAQLFKKSLKIKEDDDLRLKLAQLEIGGSEMSQQVIKESKMVELIKRAKEEIKNKNWDQATILTSEAIDIDPNYVPAVLVLADLQLKRGLFEAAIHTVTDLKERQPNNNQLLSSLINIYLKAYKLDEANKLLVEARQSKYSQTADYFYYSGQFFELKKNTTLAMKYYEEALKLDPINDSILFKEAQIYFKIRQYADAKKKLSDAIFLDPKNMEYLSLYAQIIADQDNADTAIGYLRDLMAEVGEDPKLLSTITALYFKSGQLKEFKYYYKKVQALPKKDEAFYEYLIAASKLDESYVEFEQYSKELLKINPGNLKVKMNLAEFYIEKNRLVDASNELMEIKERLPSYPKVHYMITLVLLKQNDLKAAKEMAKMELQLNPNLDSAHYIVGEVYRQAKEYREAVESFEKSISINPKSIESIMGLGWIRLNQNQANEALDLYNKALRIESNNPEIHKQLGYTYRALGQRSTAREKFEDYLKLNPGAFDRPQIEQLIRTLK